MRNISKIIFVGFLGLACLSPSCKDETNPVSKIEDIVFPESQISYNRTIQPLFNIACSVDGCHSAKEKASNLDLSDYTGIHQRFYDVVIPKDTSLSRLLWNIEARPGSARMPPQRPLTENQIRGFRRWILEGATDTIR
jgi:hypothetical protein